MLDPRSKRLLRQEPGQASSASPDRSKRAAVGAGFVSHLPTFPSAPMDHVLEARDELADSRADYRRCVRELSEKLVSSALDESLDTDIAEYWHDALLPAMNNLRTGLQGTRLVRGTARRLIGDWAAALKSGGAGAAITVGLLAPHDLRSAAVSGAGVAAAYVIGTAIQQAQDQQAEPKARELVYLNGIERSLSRSRG